MLHIFSYLFPPPELVKCYGSYTWRLPVRINARKKRITFMERPVCVTHISSMTQNPYHDPEESTVPTLQVSLVDG